MTLRGALLTFRIQRFETTVVVGAAILSVVVSAVVIALFNAGGYARCCGGRGAGSSSLCQATIGDWLNRIARMSAAIVPVFPVVARAARRRPDRRPGARERHGAAGLVPRLRRGSAGSPSGSCRSSLMVLVAGLAIGLTADALTQMVQPSVDLDASFVGYPSRGLLVGRPGARWSPRSRLRSAPSLGRIGADDRPDPDARSRAVCGRGQGRDGGRSRARRSSAATLSLQRRQPVPGQPAAHAGRGDRDVGRADRRAIPSTTRSAGTRRAGSRTSRSTSPARATTTSSGGKASSCSGSRPRS